MFQCLIAVKDQFPDTAELFTYELCSFPAALFESNGLPLEASKPQFADAMWDTVNSVQTELPDESLKYVLDGGALLQRLPWNSGDTYESICDSYGKYVTSHYGIGTTVVFDGYNATLPSTKDATHKRRCAKGIGPRIHFMSDMKFKCKKDDFLSNTENKKQFIQMLGNRLQAKGMIVYHAVGDADLLIVQMALESAKVSATVLVGDDTDLLVLLCYHYEPSESHDIFFKPEPKKLKSGKIRKQPRTWHIRYTKAKLGDDVCKNILFLHAILGCDTVSRVFGLGKGTALKKFQSDSKLQEYAIVFDKPIIQITQDENYFTGCCRKM